MRAPSAGLPQPATDFQAVRRGPQLQLHYTLPRNTSDGYVYAPGKYGPMRAQVCVWPGLVTGSAPAPAAAVSPAADTPVPPQVPARQPTQPGVQGRFRVPGGALMPPCPQRIRLHGATLPLGSIKAQTPLVTLALALENGAREWAAWSNPVVVATTPVAPPPELEPIHLTAQGVSLTWQAPSTSAQRILVYRQQQGANPERVAQLPGEQLSYLDASIAWNRSYTYWLRSGAGEGRMAVESADSRHVSVRTLDVFPPPVPTGLEVVVAPGGKGVDLSWNAVTAHDLAGYDVYRLVAAGTGWQKRNAEPLPTPVFHDSLPAHAPGVTYAVTAVSSSGNESQRSTTVAVTRP